MFNFHHFLTGLPYISLSICSDHSILDFSKEIHTKKKDVLKIAQFYTLIILLVLYSYYGFLHYYHFGEELIVPNYLNTISSFKYGFATLIIVNFLIVIYISINTIMAFRPSKSLVAFFLNKNEDDTINSLITAIIVSLPVMTISCLMIYFGQNFYLMFIFVGLISQF